MHRYTHHRGTQQSLLVFVTTLEFIEHMMIRHFGRIHHFNRFVNSRIKRLAQRNNRLHSNFL